MPSIGHIAVGAAFGRFAERSVGHARTRTMALLSAASLLPDADGMAFSLGVPYGAPWGHRGASHSLAMALAIGGLTGVIGRLLRLSAGRTAAWASAAAASHGLLDAMTDGGLGIALLWPFTNRRYFAPWRPIPVAPIGLGMLSRRGLEVVATELAMFAPLFVYAFWPHPRRPGALPLRNR